MGVCLELAALKPAALRHAILPDPCMHACAGLLQAFLGTATGTVAAEGLSKALPPLVPPPSDKLRAQRGELLQGLQYASGGYLNPELAAGMSESTAGRQASMPCGHELAPASRSRSCHLAGHNHNLPCMCLELHGMAAVWRRAERAAVYITAHTCVPACLLACLPAVAGVAYHHAGLTLQERGAVESGYRRGLLLVLCATSTLAAGINLPARRVILRSLKQGIGPVAKAQYLQMVGRAGRTGGWVAGGLLRRAKRFVRSAFPLCVDRPPVWGEG